MKALRFESFGDLSQLQVVEIDRPAPTPFDAVVAVRAASINPSDVKNVQGKMEGTTLPRVPGRDYAGVVVDGPPDFAGAEVWGLGGNLGYTEDGTHAEFVRVPVDSLSRKPSTLSFEEAAASGVNFITAWAGLVDAAHIGAGETVMVTGALGGVGSSVIQLARWWGARSIGIDRTPPSPDWPRELAADLRFSSDATMADSVLAATGGRGADVVFDTVGSLLFEANLKALAHDGRYVIISSVGERRASFDILDFYHKRLHLIGVDSRAIGTVACARILDRLRPAFEDGRLRAPAIRSRYSLDDGRAAYAAVEQGGAGRVVFTIG